MPYRRPSGQRSTISSSTASAPQPKLRNYVSQQSASRRHQFTTGTPSQGTASALAPNFYLLAEMLAFDRTFNAGVADTPPTATASNNFQSIRVFNGSKIENLDCVIQLKNNSSTVEATLDVYALELSFYDALIWDTIKTATSPVTFTSSGNDAGNVVSKTPTGSIITSNDWNNFNFTKRYLKKLGTVTIGNSDNSNIAEFKFNVIPPKCRRSQTGMYYAIIFHNDTLKNNAQTMNLDYYFQTSFDEIPSDIRLPFVD